MLKWRIWDVECQVSLLFPAAVIVMLTFDDTNLTLQCLLASFIHEWGHFFAMAAVGERPARLCMGVFGIRVERSRECRLTYGKMAFVSAAGPLMNGLCGAVLYVTAGLTEGVLIHGALAVFNLLPIAGLDGGEALYSVLCRYFSENKAHTASLVLSAVVLLPLAAVGFYLLLVTGYNFSLLVLCLYLILLLIFKEKH